MDRDELPDVPLLCAEEVDRSCAPWGLLGEDKQATMIAGIEVAVDLAPLVETAAHPLPAGGHQSRRGCARRPMCCTRADISPSGVRSTRASSR